MHRGFQRETGSGRRGGRKLPSLGAVVSALLASVLMMGTLLGLVVSEASATALPACTTASTATCAVTLNMTAGSFGVHGNGAATIPGPASITGTLDPKTGAVTGATLSRLAYNVPSSPLNTHSTETVIITQLTPGAGTGSINSLGDVSYSAALQILITIHSPLKTACATNAPVNVTLTSSAPYSSGAVTISQKNFTIPDFTPSAPGYNCLALAGSQLNVRYSGTTNVMSLSLTGAMPLPPPPTKPTTTSLTVSPTGPVLVGTTVTLRATVSATVGSTPAPAGQVTFMSGPTFVGRVPLSTTAGTETATLTTSHLPAVPTQTLTAVYSGDTKYAPSTSPAKSYSVQPKPSVSTNLAATAIVGAATPTYFTVRLTNPSIGESWADLKLTIRLAVLKSTHENVTMEYENSTGTWCPISFANRGGSLLLGTFKGLTGACGSTTKFSLPAGTSLTVHFRIAYSAAVVSFGQQTATFALQTLNAAGTVVPPFTSTVTTGVYTYAPSAVGKVLVSPATRYNPTLKTTPTVTAIPSGYQFFPQVIFTAPPNAPTTTKAVYPYPVGTYTYQVDGHTFTPPIVLTTHYYTTDVIALLETQSIPTSGLSIGSHTLTIVYSGDSVYNGVNITRAFTVVAAAPGTVYNCTRAGAPIAGSVIVSGALPRTSPAGVGTARVTLISLAVNLDGSAAFITTTEDLTDVKVNLSPGGSITAPTIVPSAANDTVTAKWTGLSATVPVTGSPGAQVPVGIESVSFTGGGVAFNCTAGSPAATIGSILVSGVTLAASPASPVLSGTNAVLAATVVPTTRGGQVNFLTHTAGSGKTVTLGTATVPTSGPTKGIARLSVPAPSVGQHSYSAQWSGTVPVSTSNTVAYTVETKPAVTKQPSAQTVKEGTAATFTATASGTPTPTVQWQVSTNGSTWSTITGATGTMYVTPVTAAADSGNKYRAVFTNGAGSATTDGASLTVVVPPSVATQPANQSAVTGNTATFSAKATGSVLAVQWQVSTNGGSSWSNAPGTPSNSFASRTTLTSAYTTPATTTANNGNQYRAVFSNGEGTATSNAATLTVTTTPPPPPPPPPPPASGTGYHLVAANGSVYSYGTAPFYGSMGGKSLSAPIVGTATTPGDGGYWLVGSDGGIFSFGNAAFYGSMGGQPLNKPIVGIAATPDGKGYWEVASDGGIFAFGDAAFYGSMGGKPLNKPIVGIASTPDGKGYWMVASDGGIFSFGDAAFYGSTGSLTLNKPIVGMASSSTGGGYWLVAADGGVFSFGNAGFHGTVAGTTSASIVSLVPTGDNGGYWETAASGQVFQFGDATSAGTALAQTATIVAMSD